MNRRRDFLSALAALGLGIVVPLLLAEGVLRLLPVNESMRAQPVDARRPVFRFAPDREIQWSRGWDFALRNRIRINNDGFVNDADYDAAATSPLLAVVGDSYIEAAMVPFAETLQGRLARLAQGRGRVYSFGASGAPLSQYLVWAAHARDAYHPRGLAVVVVGNDFEESLAAFKRGPGFHHFAERDGRLELARVDHAPDLLRRLARHSALAMYLATNVEVMAVWGRLTGPAPREATFVGNVPADRPPGVVEMSRRAVDAFLERLPAAAGLPGERILIVVDAARQAIEAEGGTARVEGSYFQTMRRHLIEAARRKGIGVLDLEPLFAAAWVRDGRPFEYPSDGHWNGYAHGLVAEAVAKSGVFDSILGDQRTDTEGRR